MTVRGSLFGLKNHLLTGSELDLIGPSTLSPLVDLIEQLGIKLNNLITTTRRSASRK